MLYPKNLEKGYKIGVTATSAGFDAEVDLIRLDNGIKHFNEIGYPVIITDNVRKSCKGKSSDGPTRARELEQLFIDSEVSAIFAASGGDYLVEMLSYVNFELIRDNPKWIQGYSDTTGLLFTLTTNLDMATIYANNFSSFGMGNWHSSLEDNRKILEGQDIEQNSYDKYQDGYKERITGFEEFELERDVEWVNLYPAGWDSGKELELYGRAIGGCLDVILSLIGTRFDKTRDFIKRYHKDKIVWFLESFDLGSEALTRGLWQLKEAGWFDHAAGFIFGRPAMYHTETDTNYSEAVLSVLGELNLPIILEADIGHKPPQFTMINGAIVHINSNKGKGCIKFERR
ncbi:MAG TPA: S66 peptidase family protein [Mobilitalea sp.]|nr:S66 peptidase family protein [Mobilitalea sp.]